MRTAWRVNRDRTQAHLRGRWGSVQIAGSGRRLSRRSRGRRNAVLRDAALVGFRILFGVDA